ncbi:ABC-ATPase domain-containing protein [Oscillatoria sp. CS-180]|uniref:ABC-ATPase domain-containing protein n=1 Tax=Oscillatoria sp. CS-180 TaxID=3021720 RepID=UPI00232B6CD1|nr:ABC-ATPase domain-containing protein [Oscillatoria sp. CS-180]MDB9526634.1 ABC-ATPase domain-containing protein [Oscillatoria sp. CS-180]
MPQEAFRDRIKSLDGQGYKAYKSLKGQYAFSQFTLHIDYVQGDPFAAPSRLRVVVPQSVAQFPLNLYDTSNCRIALEDYLIRQVDRWTQAVSTHRGSGKSGLIAITRPSQAILSRTAASVSESAVEIRFVVGLPAFGRRIAGLQAAALLCDDIPALVTDTLLYQHLDPNDIDAHCNCAENANWLRQQLNARNLVAFVADGSVLPRKSGVDERPLKDGTIPFKSPDSLRVSFTLPNGNVVTGMGIPRGITLIVGGGYHGKSTLLKAIETGVYTHIPGDGREQVVTHTAAVKVRAEDGRSVAGVDISPFINHLPQGKTTQHFSTGDASGSTSQAASIIEAIAAGATALLIDEDTSATNFMIRDHRMQALIAKDREPITPFVDKVRQLYDDYDISTILVMGGSGDYFDVADTVIALDSYCPVDVTTQAKQIAEADRTDRQAEGGETFGSISPRIVLPESINPRRGKRDVSLKVRATDEIRFGNDVIDLSAVEQLVESGQVNAIAEAIVYAQQVYFDGTQSLADVLVAIAEDIAAKGLDCLNDRLSGDLVVFRPLELAAAINRLRSLKVRMR